MTIVTPCLQAKPVDEYASQADMLIANQDERRVIKMLWSTVSKAAERSIKRQMHDTFVILLHRYIGKLVW